MTLKVLLFPFMDGVKALVSLLKKNALLCVNGSLYDPAIENCVLILNDLTFVMGCSPGFVCGFQTAIHFVFRTLHIMKQV